jgi:hypothetical protein
MMRDAQPGNPQPGNLQARCRVGATDSEPCRRYVTRRAWVDLSGTVGANRHTRRQGKAYHHGDKGHDADT